MSSAWKIGFGLDTDLLTGQPSSAGTSNGIAGKFWGDLGNSFSTSLGKSLPGMITGLMSPQPNYQNMLQSAAIIPQAMANISQGFDQQQKVALSETFGRMQNLFNAKSADLQRNVYGPISRQISLQDTAYEDRQNAAKRSGYFQGDGTLNFVSPDALARGKRLFEAPVSQSNPFFNLFTGYKA